MGKNKFEEVYKDFSVLVKQSRKNRRITQSELANAINLSRCSVANIESGRQRVPLHTFFHVCEFLGINPSSLRDCDSASRQKLFHAARAARDNSMIAHELRLIKKHMAKLKRIRDSRPGAGKEQTK